MENRGEDIVSVVPDMIYQQQHHFCRSPTSVTQSNRHQHIIGLGGKSVNAGGPQNPACSIQSPVPIVTALGNARIQRFHTTAEPPFCHSETVPLQHGSHTEIQPMDFRQYSEHKITSPVGPRTVNSCMHNKTATSDVRKLSNSSNMGEAGALPSIPKVNTRRILTTNTQKKMMPTLLKGVVPPNMHMAPMVSNMQAQATLQNPTPLPASLNIKWNQEREKTQVTELRHEMQPQHFQNTIAKARQAPATNMDISGNVHQPTLTSNKNLDSDYIIVNNAQPCASSTNSNSAMPIHSIVLASVMAAVHAKNNRSISIKTPVPVKKQKKRPKKPPLRVTVASDLPTMVPQLIDSSEKQYQCPECPRKFSWHFQLQQHSRTHSGERPFVCSECQQAYKRREHLQRHERVHTGERPFQCKDCTKKYRRRSQLIRHERVHTGERPYVCKICSKAFRRRGHLSRHFKTHANEILKKSGINPTSLKEASALLTVTVPPVSQSSKSLTGTNHVVHGNPSQPLPQTSPVSITTH